MDRKTCIKIFKIFKKQNPNPTTELKYKNTFELLISVILSAQATDISVNAATKKLFKLANTPRQILALGEKQLKEHIKTIGLANSKAANIIKTCKILITNFHSKVPITREELESLPGVGRKTANVVLNIAFGEHTIAVDTHVFRVANRIGLACGNYPIEIEKQLLEIIPDNFKQNAHHWMILHGRYVCKAKKPLCKDCTIANLCEYIDKSTD